MKDASFWLLLAASVTLISIATAQSKYCPPCKIDRVCESDLTCDADQARQNRSSVCDCCPGCEYVLGLGDFCSPTFSTKCGQGLECDVELGECVRQSGCYAFDNPMWAPSCLSDGTFAPKQCKGEFLNGRCFCYGGDGTRIFGHEWWRNAENMTCACSRRVWELETQEGRTDVSLHCNDLGNYEPLQCDRGFCWCAEERTGNLISSVVPENVMTRLPCYRKKTVGSQYLRQCESALVAQSRIAQLMGKHGTIYDITDKIICDRDGSYGNYQIENGICFCSWKDRQRIGSWAIEYAAMAGVNCNCARDSKWYADQGETFPQACIGNGNYASKQKKGNSFYCVDSDGFPTTPLLPAVDCPLWAP